MRLQGRGSNSGNGIRMTTRFNNFDHPLVNDVVPSHTMGGVPLDAFCFIGDSEATTIATASLKGRSGMAVKEQPGGWTSVFSSVPGAPATFFRNLARFAGAHCFTDVDAVVDACDNLVMIHQIGPGPLDLHVFQDWTKAVDHITGQEWPVEQGKFV